MRGCQAGLCADSVMWMRFGGMTGVQTTIPWAFASVTSRMKTLQSSFQSSKSHILNENRNSLDERSRQELHPRLFCRAKREVGVSTAVAPRCWDGRSVFSLQRQPPP